MLEKIKGILNLTQLYSYIIGSHIYSHKSNIKCLPDRYDYLLCYANKLNYFCFFQILYKYNIMFLVPYITVAHT